MKAEGNDAGEKQRNPSHDQAKREHWRNLWFVTDDKDHNR